MKYCDLTLRTPAENLACDEVLLQMAEENPETGEVLRVWEPVQYFVVIGYANRAASEVNLEYCETNTIPVLRRCSGGGAVLQGPGCLNYSLVLRIAESNAFRSIPATNEFILKRHQTALGELLQARVEIQGQTDLAIGSLKLSGNSQRRKKDFLLFHGTFLLHLDISMVEKALPMPSKKPQYRLERSHGDFLMNIKGPASKVKQALAKCWDATEPPGTIPFERISALARDKYLSDDWNLKF
jgi:lipoate-protein ligase A